MAVTPLVSIYPGSYTVTYGGNSLGMTTDDGIMIREKRFIQDVRGSQVYGETKLDGIYRGCDVDILLTLREWNAHVRSLLGTYKTSGAFNGTIGLIGVQQSALANTLVLTATASTPAATANSPASVTASGAILSGEQDTELLLTPSDRKILVVMSLIPYNSTGDRHLTMT